MKNTLTLALLFLFSSGLFAQAEEKKTNFTLKEAQDFAVENSYFTRSAVMDVTMAEQKVKEITRIGLPQITGSASYNYFIAIPTQVLPANAINPAAPSDELVPLQFGTKNNMTAGVQVNQLLFDGSYIVGLKASKTYRELAYASQAKTQVEIKRDIVKAYGLAIVSKVNYDYVKENEVKLKSLVDENQAIFEAGFMEEKDLDQVKLLLLNTQSVLIETENSYKVALDMLKFTMGKAIAEPIVLSDDIDAIKAPFIAKNENLDAKLNLETHVDYRRASANLESQSLTLSNEKMTYYPKLYGFLNMEGNSFGNDFSTLTKSNAWYPNSIIGLQLTVPIFSGGQRNMRVQQAKVGFEQAELLLEQMEQGLYLDLANKRNIYEAAMNKMDNNQKNLELSERIKNQTRIKYKEGMSSSVELTQTENQFLTSQINFVLSMYDVITSKADLDYALGKL